MRKCGECTHWYGSASRGSCYCEVPIWAIELIDNPVRAAACAMDSTQADDCDCYQSKEEKCQEVADV